MRSRHLAALLVLLSALAVLPAAAPAAAATVRIDTILAEGGEPIWDAADIAAWRLHDNGEIGPRVARKYATPAKLTLEPGRYRVVVEHKEARAVQDIEVDGADSETTMNLDAGRATLRLLNGAGGAEVEAPLTWEVRRYEAGEASGAKVVEVEGAQPTLLLDSGWYEVRVRHAGQQYQHTITVKPGRSFIYDLVAKR